MLPNFSVYQKGQGLKRLRSAFWVSGEAVYLGMSAGEIQKGNCGRESISLWRRKVAGGVWGGETRLGRELGGTWRVSGHLLASGWPATALLGPPGRWESFPGGSTTAKEKTL